MRNCQRDGVPERAAALGWLSIPEVPFRGVSRRSAFSVGPRSGQRLGGIAQGIAEVVLEEFRYDADGNPLTTNLAGYLAVSAAELPSFELLDMETPTRAKPLGVKGIGEAGTIGAILAVHAAVCDALAHLGLIHLDLPLTPERIWRALQGPVGQ